MPGKRYGRQFKLPAARLVLEGEIPVKGLSDQLSPLMVSSSSAM